MISSTKINRKRKIVNIILFIIFLLFAILQLNDPDPIHWFSIYLLVAFTFLYANYKQVPRILVWFIIIGLILYALVHFSYFMNWLQIENKKDIFGEMVYEKPYLEGTREFLGLLIAALSLCYHLKK